tara:strand:- start:7608 stop:8051 length:444 start_codon:yes stop_codon:yes gene_type:complete
MTEEQGEDAMSNHRKHRIWLRAAGVIAVLFGLLTIREGGTVLLWSEWARLAVGNYVPFVVWFNFIAGFAYVAAGLALWFQWRWAGLLTFTIAAITLAVFAIFGMYVAGGGVYEMRTVVAMSLRSLIWIVLAMIVYRHLPRLHRRPYL